MRYRDDLPAKHGRVTVNGVSYDGALVEERTIQSLRQYAGLVDELRASPWRALALGRLQGGSSHQPGRWADVRSRWLTLAIEQFDGSEVYPRFKLAKHLTGSWELSSFVAKLMKRSQMPEWFRKAPCVLQAAPSCGFQPGVSLFLTYRLARPHPIEGRFGHAIIANFLNDIARKAGFDHLFSENIYKLGQPIGLRDPIFHCVTEQRGYGSEYGGLDISPAIHRAAIGGGWKDELHVPEIHCSTRVTGLKGRGRAPLDAPTAGVKQRPPIVQTHQQHVGVTL
jgi:hypothetical protein